MSGLSRMLPSEMPTGRSRRNVPEVSIVVPVYYNEGSLPGLFQELCRIEALLQGGGEARGIHVPGSLAGGEKKRNGWHVRQRNNQSLAGSAEGSAAPVASAGRCSSCSLYWS